MALMEFSMIPLDKGGHFSEYVARTLTIIDESGLDYRLNPMGTVVEGEWDELVALLTRCYKAMDEHADRITATVKFDCKKGVTGALTGKVASVQSKVDRTLKT